MKIGVVSDTHNFFDSRIPGLLAGVEHILHGGDIGQPRIIHELESIAPVTAVLGNTDDTALPYRQTEVIQLGELKFLVHHIVNPRQLDDSLAARIRREQPDVVIFGHTHKPFNERFGGTLYFNPGYAGHSRFGMERSLAILHCEGKQVRAEFIRL